MLTKKLSPTRLNRIIYSLVLYSSIILPVDNQQLVLIMKKIYDRRTCQTNLYLSLLSFTSPICLTLPNQVESSSSCFLCPQHLELGIRPEFALPPNSLQLQLYLYDCSVTAGWSSFIFYNNFTMLFIGSTYFQMKFQVEAAVYKLLPFSNTEPFRGHLETVRLKYS